jgi:hypothetical protein
MPDAHVSENGVSSMTSANRWRVIAQLATVVGVVSGVAFGLGMCPPLSEIQTTIEANSEHRDMRAAAESTHSRMEVRSAAARAEIHRRIDAMDARVKKNEDEHKDFRDGMWENRELVIKGQVDVLDEIRKLQPRTR